jgi:hypothetical protein
VAASDVGTHPELLGERQARDVVGLRPRPPVLSAALHGDLAEQVQDAGLRALLAALTSQTQRALGELARLGHLAVTELRLAEIGCPLRFSGPTAQCGLLDGLTKEWDPLARSPSHRVRVAQHGRPRDRPDEAARVL